MRVGLVEALVRLDRTTWLVVAVLWVLTCGLLLGQRGAGRTGFVRVTALLALASATSFVGLALSTAVSVPRIVWRAAERSDLARERGETWRRLRGPTVQVVVGGTPDVALPTVNAAGEWILYGLLSGRPLPGLPPAAPKAPEVGGLRICGTGTDACRAWPAEWPDPARAPALDELVWSRDGAAQALAYDVESNLFLQPSPNVSTSQQAGALELVGRLTNDAPREGASALFVLRRIHGGRLSAVRVVAVPASPVVPEATPTADPQDAEAPGAGGPDYRLQRSEVSLTLGPRMARWFARPLLFATALALPSVLMAYALAPIWLAARLRRRGAVRRQPPRPLALGPVERRGEHGPVCIATVLDDTEIGDATLIRGTVVHAAVLFDDGRAVTSRTWLELPPGDGEDRAAPPWARAEPPGGLPADGGAERAPGADGPYRSRRVGLLVPADALPFRRAARAWLLPHAYTTAVLATGIAAAAPAIVALVSLLASR